MRKRKRGPKFLPPGKALEVIVTMRLRKEQRDRFEEKAAECGLPMTTWLRLLGDTAAPTRYRKWKVSSGAPA